MTELTTYDWGRRLLDLNAGRAERPGEFSLFGRSWELLDGVFAPVYCYSTQLFTSWVPFPVGGSLLEVGSGAGVLAVEAALAGCAEVTAVDISEVAVVNTRRNVARHGVGDRVRVLRSDLFAALPADARFDVVFWNSNFIEPAEDLSESGDLAGAIFDPGYVTHRTFLAEGPARLNPGGRLLLGFSSLGNRERLDALLAEQGLRAEVLRAKAVLPELTYQILAIEEA
jgi:release factor glutamine methyltransferase